MATMLSEEQFLCCVCLDIFNEPVSIPCGHNFCLACIRRVWDTCQRAQCPLCKEGFHRRPELRINRSLAEITEHFKMSLKVKEESSREAAESGALEGTESRVGTSGRRNQCGRHQRPLDLFCRKERIAVCSRCVDKEHRGHDTVPAERESRRIRAQLLEKQAEFKQMIQERLEKVWDMRESVQSSKRAIEREMKSGRQVFTDLLNTLERLQAEVMEQLEERQREVERRAQSLTEELEQEITDLIRRDSELELLAQSEDHLHVLQTYPSLLPTPNTKDWSEVSGDTDQCVGSIRRALSKLRHTLHSHERSLCEPELRRVQRYAVDVTLDPMTASPWLVLSEDRKQVRLGYHPPARPPPDNPRRFDSCVCVLGANAFTTGRWYWAVKVGDKPDWDLGVVRETVNRKGAITVRPDQGFWAVCRRKGGHLLACAGPSVPLTLPQTPETVGLFVDYEEGLVAFYDVEACSHIYTFSGCSFTEALHPYFNPCVHDSGKNTAPLVICPVVQDEVILPDQQIPSHAPGRSGVPRSRASYHRPVTHQNLFQDQL